MDLTVTVPSENPHDDAALAAPARATSVEAIRKRIAGDGVGAVVLRVDCEKRRS